MSGFSFFSLFTAGLACLIPFTSAYTPPKGPNPKGNPIIQPGLNSLVPAGKGFIIEWQPTTEGNITLILLKGPSTNAEPLGVIAENIANNGTYNWVPSTQLQPSPAGQATGYGIQLIVDATGQYQYSTQFGISNPQYKPGDHWGNLGTVPASSTTTSAAKSTITGKTSATPSAPAYSSIAASNSKNATTTTKSWGHTTISKVATVTSVSSGLLPTRNATTTATIVATSSIPAISSTGALTTPPVPTASSTTPPTNGASMSTASFLGLVIAAAAAVYTL